MPADEPAKEAAPAASKVAKKVAKAMARGLGPATVVEMKVKEIAGAETEVNPNSVGVENTVKDAVKKARQRAVKDLVEEAVATQSAESGDWALTATRGHFSAPRGLIEPRSAGAIIFAGTDSPVP
jgi:hypothetical protein